MLLAARRTTRVRATAIGLTLLAHSVLLVVIEIERRSPRRDKPQQLQYVSFWAQPPRQTPPGEPEELEQPDEPASASGPPPRPPEASRAITVPASAAVPVAPVAPAPPSTTPAPAPQGNVDWDAAVAKAAARVAEEAASPKTFGPPLNAIPEPCVPRKFDAATRKLMDERAPRPADPPNVGPDPNAGALIVGGRPMPVQKIGIPLGRAEPRGDLFDNMAEEKKPSSVPSPHFCD